MIVIFSGTFALPSFQALVKEFLYVSAASHLLQITETNVCTDREDHIHALRVLSAHAPGERYATVLCQEMFLAGQYAEAEAEIEQIVQDKPEEFILNLLKVGLLHSISTSIKIYLYRRQY